MLPDDDRATSSPPPLAGEGQGGGTQYREGARNMDRAFPAAPSPTLPRKRGREQTERVPRANSISPKVVKGQRKRASQQVHARAADLLAWYDRHRRALPLRAAPGERPDPYRVWLSEVMLQQTTTKAVAPYFARLCARSRQRRSRTCSSCGPASAITRARGICMLALRRSLRATTDVFHAARRRSPACQVWVRIRPPRSRRSRSMRRLRRSTAMWNGWWRGFTRLKTSCPPRSRTFGDLPNASCQPSARVISRKR